MGILSAVGPLISLSFCGTVEMKVKDAFIRTVRTGLSAFRGTDWVTCVVIDRCT